MAVPVAPKRSLFPVSQGWVLDDSQTVILTAQFYPVRGYEPFGLFGFPQHHPRPTLVDDEKFIDMATSISGSGPAYVFQMVDAMVDTAVHMGPRIPIPILHVKPIPIMPLTWPSYPTSLPTLHLRIF